MPSLTGALSPENRSPNSLFADGAGDLSGLLKLVVQTANDFAREYRIERDRVSTAVPGCEFCRADENSPALFGDDLDLVDASVRVGLLDLELLLQANASSSKLRMSMCPSEPVYAVLRGNEGKPVGATPARVRLDEKEVVMVSGLGVVVVV